MSYVRVQVQSLASDRDDEDDDEDMDDEEIELELEDIELIEDHSSAPRSHADPTGRSCSSMSSSKARDVPDRSNPVSMLVESVEDK